MASAQLSTLLNMVLEQKTLDQTMISKLRRQVYADGHVTTDEADKLFLINTSIEDISADWNAFFVGSMTDFLIRQTPPMGYIDESNAAWLMQRIDHDGVIELETEFELLMNVLHLADKVPERLELYALRQVKSCVLDGQGYLASGRELIRGQVGEYEVELLRRILYACGGDGGIGISKSEAELLFEIDEATQNTSNHKDWQDFFVKAIANHLMTMGAPNVPSIEEAHQRESWLKSGKGLEFNLVKSFQAWRNQHQVPVSHWLNKGGIQTAEKVDAIEAAWLIERLNRDGVLSSNERALLTYLKAESPNIHDSLTTLIHAA